MIRSKRPLKFAARLRPWLGRACVGSIFAALAVAACSVPDFQFPEDAPLGFAGDGSVIIDHCVNGLLEPDLGETDFDCGGGCSPCGLGQHCADVADCAEGLCHEGTCIAAGCMNAVQDGVETDVDCGGGGCNPCITAQHCALEQDCESGVCVDALCLAPACDDQVKNGKETSLDCGGDCPGCRVDEPCVAPDDCISLECTAGICGPECPDGLANCDGQNANACEVNTRVDAMNCGTCGNVCALPHAASECSAGECRIETDGCEAGYADCNGLSADGCEVNLEQDKLNCGACTKVCPELNGAPFCEAGECQITCSKGFDDCDNNRDNGCEKDVSRDVNNCGECTNKCAAPNGGTPYCKDDVCGETNCPAGFGDCNGEPDDGPNGNGCEVDLRSDPLNCNSCGNICVANNGTAACNNRVCQIDECDDGFDNCGGGYADGCETNINTSVTHCGGCNKGCTVQDGVAKCDMGGCAIGSCNGTFRDCNSSPADGCEINIATNTKNCGGCAANGSDCSTKYANATSTCFMSACQTPTCNANYGDCSGGLADGCETDTRTTEAHCGGCTKACQNGPGANVKTNECLNSQCQPDCAGTFENCDGDGYDGCEANVNDDEDNCGECGTVCSAVSGAHVDSNECVSGACDPDCAGTYGDCDTSRPNGCETNTASSSSNCGGCGAAFVCKQPGDASAHVSSNTCSGSDCQPVCSGLWGNCDGDGFNGCEHNVSNDEDNCGGCGASFVCGSTNASARDCSSGTCAPTCDPGWGACTNPKSGCTDPLYTAQHCRNCAENCTATNTLCDASKGCVSAIDIVVAPPLANQANMHDMEGWDGTNPPDASVLVDHTITYAKGSSRMVLIGVVSSDPLLDPIEVTYDGKQATRAVYNQDSTPQSHAAIYYLLDADLPTNAGTVSNVVAKLWEGRQWGHGGLHVLELKNAEQIAPFATSAIATSPTWVGTGAGCGSSSSRSHGVTFATTGPSGPSTYAKSLVFAVLSGRGATAATISASAGLVEVWNQQQPTPNNHLGAAAYVIDDDSRSISWSLANCYNSAIALVAVQRLTAP